MVVNTGTLPSWKETGPEMELKTTQGMINTDDEFAVMSVICMEFHECPTCAGSGDIEDETAPFFRLIDCRECGGRGGHFS